MRKKRILIVEDEMRVALALGRALQDPSGGDYEVEICYSADDALIRLRHEKYDLVITDLRMPGSSGLELIRHVREISPETRTVLITAFGSPEVEEQTKKLATTYVTKPFSLRDFIATVHNILSEDEQDMDGRRLLVLGEEAVSAIAAVLNKLRDDLGASLIMFSDLSGRTVAEAGSLPGAGVDLGAINALLGSSMAAATEMASLLQEGETLDLYFHEGDRYDIYAAAVGDEMLLSVFFDRTVATSRIGIVWLYMKRTISELSEKLTYAVADESGDGEIDYSLANVLGDALERALGADQSPEIGEE